MIRVFLSGQNFRIDYRNFQPENATLVVVPCLHVKFSTMDVPSSCRLSLLVCHRESSIAVSIVCYVSLMNGYWANPLTAY